ncbi:MAG: T9SS type A sorting domain-containing protein [Saprospiraceae bacterium]
MNSPQFSAVDFNNDGLQDVFVFDRVGDVPLAMVRQADGSLVLDLSMLSGFPPLQDWVLLRDYNQDGIQDIFTYNRDFVSGIRVFKGSYENNKLVFSPFPFGVTPNIIMVSTPSGTTQLYVSDIDYPDISDLDCDGDLDILTFNLSGGYIEYYKNLSIENGFGTDSLRFTLAENCYGGIYESGITAMLDLASAPGECAQGIISGEVVTPRHVGSTLLCFDNDGDGDKDLLLGDLSFPNLNMATNGGNCNDAWMNAQDASFPSYDQPVDLPIFPAAFFMDVDLDGRRDLVAAPNLDQNGIDHENVWLYLNDGTDSDPSFNFQQTDWLVRDMIDLGTRSHPAAIDYNADGLMDLVVSNFSYFELFGAKNTRLLLYENTGTLNQPAFTLVDEDFLNMNQFSADQTGQGTFDLAPTFGDLDGDGDWDALVGEVSGNLFFVENTAGPGEPAQFAAPAFGYMDIDPGQSVIPQIVDLNRDGLADIILGEKNGNINYYQNTGTVGAPQFDSDETALPNVRNLGQVDARIPGYSTGYSAPTFVDFDGEWWLFMGTQFGQIEVYNNINNQLAGEAFTLLSEQIAQLSAGEHLHLATHDWNADGFLDFIVGNERGGLNFYHSNISLSGVVPVQTTTTAPLLATVSPNPGSTAFQVEILQPTPATITIWNTAGQRIHDSKSQEKIHFFDANEWPAGMYIIRVQSDRQQQLLKWMKI